MRDAVEELLTAMVDPPPGRGLFGRYALGSLARYVAEQEPGKWARVGTIAVWGRLLDGSFQIAFQRAAAKQIPRPVTSLADLSEKRLTQRANACGIVAPEYAVDNRISSEGRQERVIVLSAEFTAALSLARINPDRQAEMLQAVIAKVDPRNARKAH